MKIRSTKRLPFTRRCDSCRAVAAGTITFIAADGTLSIRLRR